MTMGLTHLPAVRRAFRVPEETRPEPVEVEFEKFPLKKKVQKDLKSK